MIRYTVVFKDEGTFVGRDARWFKVEVLKERHSLGTALGIIDEPSWERELPGGGDGPGIFSNAAVRLLAIRIQDAIESGQFRNDWEIEAEEFFLEARDARHLVNTGIAEPKQYTPGASVAFFTD